MADRTLPYGAFNFLVNLGNGTSGGFSDVSGLGTELTVADYRTGNEKVNHVHKVPLMHKSSDVTLKRGIVKSADLWAWVDDVRRRGVLAKRDVTITLLNETGEPVEGWKLHDAVPLKYTGPTLAAKGGSDVAMEELVLNHEELEYLPAG
jgi:phage tail-like protein